MVKVNFDERKEEREKAKAIICEIIHQSGGSFSGKVRLYKAFYHANFRYAEMKRDWLEELTEWPMVRLPNGPGIDEGTQLLEELEQEGHITITEQPAGEFTEYRYETLYPNLYPLKAEEKIAISHGVKTVGGRSGRELSHWSHEFCNTWKFFKDGDRINIHHDMLSESEFLRMREANQWAEQLIKEIFPDGKL